MSTPNPVPEPVAPVVGTVHESSPISSDVKDAMSDFAAVKAKLDSDELAVKSEYVKLLAEAKTHLIWICAALGLAVGFALGHWVF
jgi:hypothetical protein